MSETPAPDDEQASRVTPPSLLQKIAQSGTRPADGRGARAATAGLQFWRGE